MIVLGVLAAIASPMLLLVFVLVCQRWKSDREIAKWRENEAAKMAAYQEVRRQNWDESTSNSHEK